MTRKAAKILKNFLFQIPGEHEEENEEHTTGRKSSRMSSFK
jgi:hypothetical protein